MTDEPTITNAIHFLPTPFTLADAQQLIAGKGDGRDCFWGVWLRGSAALIGTVGTHLRGADEIEIGYWLASSAHGHGFGAEAASSIVRALKSAYPAYRIIAECRPQNEASWRLLEKIGFKADGRDGLRSGRKRLIFA
jgi:RimJ/RimL family protein N-acetyltransferase